MRTLLLGECDPKRIYSLTDPDAPGEQEFEMIVARALTCAYPGFWCVVFGGGFRLDGRTFKPDLALIAKDFSHWFILEVELASHSLERHVFPQVRAFQYGEPQQDCETILARELGLDRGRAGTLVRLVPHSVAVIVNREDARWRDALRVANIQMLVVSRFKNVAGEEALYIDGTLDVLAESLGFGTYSATDRSLRFPKTVRLSDGAIQLCDFEGTPSVWNLTRGPDAAWITKEVGLPDIDDGAHVQIVRTFDGRLSLRRPP